MGFLAGPIWASEQKGLSPGAKLVLIALAENTCAGDVPCGHAPSSTESLLDFVDCTVEELDGYIRELEAKHRLRIERFTDRDGNPMEVYTLLFPNRAFDYSCPHCSPEFRWQMLEQLTGGPTK